jgi:flagellar basal-body rod protein FlgF
MQNGLYVAVSAQVALERRLETLADNIANMNTVGYRATGVSFEAEIAKAGETALNYVSPGSDYVSRRIGGLVKTDNSLDFAVQGDGWFGIQTPSGPAYTRDGRTRIESPERCARCQATPSSTPAAPRSLSTAQPVL